MHCDCGQLVTLIAQQRLSLGDVTRRQCGGSISRLTVNGQTKESSGAGGGAKGAKDTSKAGQKVLLTLVGNIVSDFGANGSHGIGASSQSSQVTSLKSTTTVQDHANLLVSSDFARGQAAAVRQHLKVAGKVGFPERNVDKITTLSSVQLSHGLHHTASQEGITLGGLLNDVRRKNLWDDDVRAKSRHD